MGPELMSRERRVRIAYDDSKEGFAEKRVDSVPGIGDGKGTGKGSLSGGREVDCVVK